MRALVAAFGAVVLALGPLPTSNAAPARGAGDPGIELVSQTPLAVAGDSFVAALRLEGMPADGTLSLALNGRIRSRSELAQSMEGEGLRGSVFHTASALSDLPARPDGTRRVAISFDAASGGLTLPEGVYPLELTVQDAAGNALDTLVTHVIVPPESGDDAPNLAVALVAELGAPPALQPGGSVTLRRTHVEDLAALVAGLAAAPGVPATIDASPETIEALQRSTEPGDLELVAAMRAAVTNRTVVEEPYVPLDLDALASAELLSELQPQVDRGRAVLTDALGVAPDQTVRVAPSSLGEAGLTTLAYTGTTRLLLDDDQVEPLAGGTIRYSLAQPFVVAVPEEADVDDRTPGAIRALTPDPLVLERLDSDGAPGLVVSRVLAELALLRLEQPSVARTVVVPLEPGLSSDVVRQLLTALGTGRPFAAVSLADAFEHAAPVLDGGGNPAERALVPDRGDRLSEGTARAIAAGRADLGTFRSLVGISSSLPDAPSRHLLLATAAGLDDDERRAHVNTSVAAMDGVTSKVSSPASFTLTLTARDGTIPLTIRNDSGVPLRVSIRLRSQKLEFPEGDTIERELTEETTRIDIRVRSRATGAFPLIIDVRTPDGLRILSTSRYTVRSTAVSGAGLLLSVGAGLFLTVWWARHWRRTRRSRKLIAANGHPAHLPRRSPSASSSEQ